MKNKTKYLYAIIAMLLFSITLNGVAFIVNRTEISEEKYVSYNNTMTQNDAESVIAVIQAENFDEAFSHYSTYKDISDVRFHALRIAYLNAREELMDYLNEAAHQKEVPHYLRDYRK